jgi:NAD(P)-dependent dehydrogenase (short-subunit alcohol dehydrogenase family)
MQYPRQLSTSRFDRHTDVNSRARDDLERRAALIPLKRMGTVDDVTNLVFVFAVGRKCYMTGAEISVDGGLSL